MPGYVFASAPAACVPVQGDERVFPVRRILCVGRNYAAHAREMGGDGRSPPFFFAKPADAITPAGTAIAYPSRTHNLHHEVELVVAIGKAGADLTVAGATDLVFGYAVGVDLTRRDLQSDAKSRGEPWEAGKAFDASAPIGSIKRWSGAPPQGAITLSVNSEVRQQATLADMVWNVPEVICEASRLWSLAPGDLIFTGTPEGVGPLAPGDAVHCRIEAVGDLAFSIAA